MTGSLVNPGSPAFFLVLVVLAGAVLFIYSKLNHPGYERLEDSVKKELADIKARAGASFPKFAADIEAKAKELQAQIDALRK